VACTIVGQRLIKGCNNPKYFFVLVHNEHGAFTIILFCALTVQTNKKWEKLKNACDVEQRQNKIFITTEMQTRSERLSDTQNKKKQKTRELCRHKAPVWKFLTEYDVA
jgi:hypothetical protein